MEKKQFPMFIYLLVKRVIPLLMQEEKISELEAIEAFYQSTTYELLSDETTKYWWLSSEALYEDYQLRKSGEIHV